MDVAMIKCNIFNKGETKIGGCSSHWVSVLDNALGHQYMSGIIDHI